MAERTRFTGLPGEDPRFQVGGSFVNASQVRGLQRLLGERDTLITDLTSRLETVEGLVTQFGLDDSSLWLPTTTWSPTVAQGAGSSTTLTTVIGVYGLTNGWCDFLLHTAIATVTSVSAGQQVTVSLPVTPHTSMNTGSRFGRFAGYDASTGANNRSGYAVLASTSTMRFSPDNPGTGVWGAADPNFAIAAGDTIITFGRYPVA